MSYQGPTEAVEELLQEHSLTFRSEILAGLTAVPKHLPSKYFYDQEGDKLFQQIMASPEYYLTDCEAEIFREQTAALAEPMLTDLKHFDLIELGAGDATKSVYLLDYLVNRNHAFTYLPIDISSSILQELQQRMHIELPELKVKTLPGEYFPMLEKASLLSNQRKVILFLGANIGNMPKNEALVFCRELRRWIQPGDLVLLGFDLVKHPQTILDAYTDKAGWTSQFNLNLLKRINRELGADFKLDQFEHYQTYDPMTGACKSYLVSLCNQTVWIGSTALDFQRNESIFMEISQKYTLEEISWLAKESGFALYKSLFDERQWFTDTFWMAS